MPCLFHKQASKRFFFDRGVIIVNKISPAMFKKSKFQSYVFGAKFIYQSEASLQNSANNACYIHCFQNKKLSKKLDAHPHEQIHLTIKKLSNIHPHEQGNLSKKIVIENCSCKLRLRMISFCQLWCTPSKAYSSNHWSLETQLFPLEAWLMKPYTKLVLKEKQHNFNYRLSRARMVVECSYGQLKGRFYLQLSPPSIDFIYLPVSTPYQ